MTTRQQEWGELVGAPVNYRSLLKKFMEHVDAWEGSFFQSLGSLENSSVKFTPLEIKAIRELAELEENTDKEES